MVGVGVGSVGVVGKEPGKVQAGGRVGVVPSRCKAILMLDDELSLKVQCDLAEGHQQRHCLLWDDEELGAGRFL